MHVPLGTPVTARIIASVFSDVYGPKIVLKTMKKESTRTLGRVQNS